MEESTQEDGVIWEIARAWFLVDASGVANGRLVTAARAAWDEINKDYDRSPKTTFVVRSDVVSGVDDVHIIAPAAAPSKPELEQLREKFERLLRNKIGNEEENSSVNVKMAFVEQHWPDPPQDGAPGYIAQKEEMSPMGPLRDNPHG